MKMVSSRVLGFFAITLCFVACLSASALVTEDEANRAVWLAKDYIYQVYDIAYNDFTALRFLLSNARIYKREAEAAASAAALTAQGNAEAQVIAEGAKKVLEEVLKKYPQAFAEMEKAFNVTKQHLVKAKALKESAESAIHILAEGTFPNQDYRRRKTTAGNITSEAENLKKEIEKSVELIADALTASTKVESSDKSPILTKYRVEGIVTVSKIDAMLKTAESYIKDTLQKIDEINATVKEMEKLEEISPSNVSNEVSILRYHAKDAFGAASSKLKEAVKTKAAIIKQQEEAVAALGNITTEAQSEEARQLAITVKHHAKVAAEKLLKIKKALFSVTITVENTKFRKLSAMKAMGMKIDSVAVSDDSNRATPSNTDKTHFPVKETTGQPANGGTHQPMNKESGKSITGKSGQPINGAPVGSIGKKSGEQKNEKSIPTITEKEVRPIMDQVNQPLKNKIESTVNGGTELKRHLSSHIGELADSAVTVSVSLLIALIACAAMH